MLLLAVVSGTAAAADDVAHAAGMSALRERMRQLEALVFERTLTPLAIDRERARRADEISALAGELAAAAAALAETDRGALGGEDRRQQFLSNARRLGEEAAELARVAEERRVSVIAQQIDRLGEACAGCHADFRPGRTPR